MILQSGRDEIISLIGNGLSGSKISGINIGTSDDAVEDTQTALQSPLDSEAGLTASQSGDSMSLVNTFTDNSGTVNEVGLYTDDEDDTQISRQVVGSVNLESQDTLEVTLELALSDISQV